MKKLFLALFIVCSGLLFLTQLTTAQTVTGLSEWEIYLDPGHAFKENMGIYNYSEAEKVLRVALNIRQMLYDQTDVDTVYICRENDFTQISLTQRTDHANSVGADFYHSIHSDAGPPTAESIVLLWGGWFKDGNTANPIVEKTPNGGKKMGDFMNDYLRWGMRVPTRGSYADRSFYMQNTGNEWPYLHVNRESAMASVLSEGGYHTNPTQNMKNMNAEYKKLEAQTHFWSYMSYFGFPRPKVGIVTGIISDYETNVPINGATVTIGEKVYTTDTFESLFNRYSSNPDQLRNGFYYLEDIPTNQEATIIVSAPNYYNDTLKIEQLNDTTFNFADFTLISNALPVVSAVTPTDGNSAVEPTERIEITFSRKMNRALTEAAFSISPSVEGSFSWANDFKLVFTPAQNISFETTYTVTVASTAKDMFGHAFDGNKDGQPGGEFTFSFTTSKTDFDEPEISAFNPISDVTEIHPRSPFTLVFNEIVSSGLSTSSFVLTNKTSNTTVKSRIRKHDINNRTTMNFFPNTPLIPNNEYEFVIKAGMADKYGNTRKSDEVFSFTVSGIQEQLSSLDNFESGIDGNWWAPQQSGSTTGIITESTSRAPESVFVTSSASRTAMRINYGWDTSSSSFLIRQYLGGGTPFNTNFTANHVLSAYIFGDGLGNQLRFVVRDGNDHLEASNWITVDWLGWKLITWDLKNDAVNPWAGNANGVIEGNCRFDSFQLTYNPLGTGNIGSYVIDELSISTVTTVSTEQETRLPTEITLYQNFPNPFNPSTTISFSLPAAQPVNLSIYDIMGRRIAQLVNEQKSAGTHTVQFDASGLASGMYFYRLETPNNQLMRKMMLIK